MLQVPFQDDVCIVVRTVLLSGDRFVSFISSITMIGQQPRTMFTISWLILLLAATGTTPIDQDATAAVLLLPLGLYMIFTEQYILYP